MKKKCTKYRVYIAVMLGLIALLNLIACSAAFCDWYAARVYPHLAEALGRLTAPLPFALAEVLNVIEVLGVFTAIAALILLPFLRKKQGYRRFCKGIWKTVPAAGCFVGLIVTVLGDIPFRCTTLLNENGRKQFTYAEVYAVDAFIVETANAAAEEIPLDENGQAVFPSDAELTADTVQAMTDLAAEYPRLAGYYPPVKNSMFSDILNRLHIGGYADYTTLEMVHSRYCCTPLEQPRIDAHESCHFKGFRRESEADFLSTLALLRSGNPCLRLSGCLRILKFLDDALREAEAAVADDMIAAGELEPLPDNVGASDPRVKAYAEKLSARLHEHPSISSRAAALKQQSDGIASAIYSEDAHPIDEMPAVDETIGKIADLKWEMQAADLKEHDYSGMVLLYLQYDEAGKLF